MNNSFPIFTGNIDFEKIITFIEKLFFLSGAFLYLIFAIVIIRQIGVMKKTVITDLSPTITLLGLIHLVISIVVFVGFLLFL